MSLVQPPALLSGGGQSSAFSVLVDWLDDPIDLGISSNGLVLRVDEDDLEVLVGGVLVDPVGVKDSQVGTAATNTLLSGRLKGSLVLQLVDSLVRGLTIGGTLWNRLLATSTSDTDTVDNVSLLGLISETASLIGTRWAGSTVDDIYGQLAI